MPGSARRALLIAAHFPPSGRVGAKRPLRFAIGLKSLGWEILVLTMDDAATRAASEYLDPGLTPKPEEIPVNRTRAWLPVQRLAKIDRRLIAAEGVRSVAGLSVRLIRRTLDLLSLPDSFVGWLPFAYPAALRLFRNSGFDVILATSGPPSVFVLGWLVSRRTGRPLVLDYRDPWTTQTDPRYRPAAVRRLLERGLERLIARHATHIVHANPGRVEEYLALLGPDLGTKLSCIENAVDPIREVAPENQENPQAILLYAGSFHGGRSLRPILNAVEALHDAGLLNPERFAIEVRGPVDEATLAYLRNDVMAKSYVRLVDPLPYRDVQQRMARATALLLLVTRELAADYPAKLFDYWSARRPILCVAPQDSAPATIIARSRTGLCCEPSDNEALRNALQRIANRDVPYSPDPSVLDQFGVPQLLGKLSGILERAASPCAIS